MILWGEISAESPDIPLFLLTGKSGGSLCSSAFELGATRKMRGPIRTPLLANDSKAGCYWTTRNCVTRGSTAPRTYPVGEAATARRNATVSAVICSPGNRLGIPGG